MLEVLLIIIIILLFIIASQNYARGGMQDEHLQFITYRLNNILCKINCIADESSKDKEDKVL